MVKNEAVEGGQSIQLCLRQADIVCNEVNGNSDLSRTREHRKAWNLQQRQKVIARVSNVMRPFTCIL